MTRILTDVPMSLMTTFKIGGAAKKIYVPQNAQDAVQLARELDTFRVLGNGSNILACDEGIAEPIIHIGREMSAVRADGETIDAQAGATLAQIAHSALSAGLCGLEFAAGIPGTAGGGVIMNAGAYGGEMRDVVQEVTFVDEKAQVVTYSAKQMRFEYRKSALSDRRCTVVGVKFCLKRADREQIREKMNSLAAARREKQPLEYPSAGSAFKRPEGHFAAELIDRCGLKGFSVGGACVSEKHAGFVINKGGATAGDVKELLARVEKIVFEKTGVVLQREVKIWD
ncbi:MAG: UDP-N-acetylmuramate dehydrogenase [Clostridia bacterium]|nr:UDP-N-acetylmuramate dehydrogenase [Clostridia bacterium]